MCSSVIKQVLRIYEGLVQSPIPGRKKKKKEKKTQVILLCIRAWEQKECGGKKGTGSWVTDQSLMKENLVSMLRGVIHCFKHSKVIRSGFFFLFFFFCCCCAGWRYIVAFTKVLTIYKIYHTWIHPLHHSLLPPSPVSGTVSTGIIFPFVHMCTQHLHYIHLIHPMPFPHLLLHPHHWYQLPQARLVLSSCSLIL
jgi:hypothetical protein